METQDIKAEIAALEIQYYHLEMLLDKSIRKNVVFAETKIIYHDMKLVADRLENLKKMKV